MAENGNQIFGNSENQIKRKRSMSYFVFLLEWKKENAPALDNHKVDKMVRPLWKKLNQKQENIYTNYAKKFGIVPEDVELKPGGMELISSIDKLEKKMLRSDNQQIRKNVIENSMAISKIGILQKKFYFIHLNYFTKSKNNLLHIPAELAIFEYSIAGDLKRSYTTHVIPEANDSLLGIEYDAITHSNKTHKLPFLKDFSDDPPIRHLYKRLTDFVMPDSQGVYDLYTNHEDITIMESCLLYLKKNAQQETNINFKVHSLQNLLYCLGSVYIDGNLDVSDIERLFTNDTDEYAPGISCEHHESNDRIRFCSKSIVFRWGFMFDKIFLNFNNAPKD